MGITLCGWCAKCGECVETGPAAKTRTREKGTRTADETSAKRCTASAGERESAGVVTDGGGMEERSLETGSKEQAHFPVRRPSCPARSSRLLARRAAPGRMAPRMAVGGEGTHKILVLHAAG